MDLLIQMLPECFRKISTHIDYPGQKKAERWLQVILIVHGVVGFFVGFFFERISYMIYTILFGTLVAALFILPPWPVFRRHPLNWQPKVEEPEETAESHKSEAATPSKSAEAKKNTKKHK